MTSGRREAVSTTLPKAWHLKLELLGAFFPPMWGKTSQRGGKSGDVYPSMVGDPRDPQNGWISK